MADKVDVEKIPKNLFINNEFVPAVSGKTFPTINPANGEVICQVASGGPEDVDLAVAAAKAAFKNGEWSKTTSYQRGILLNKLAELCQQNRKVLAAIEALDNGKPYKQALTVDVPLVIQCFRYYAGWADKITGQTLELGGPFVADKSSMWAFTKHQPVGVVGQLLPWNFPLLMAAWKWGPALATGCSIVMKPASYTSLSLLYLCQLAKLAGFPAGAINVVTGSGSSVGNRIVEHPDVNKIAFTGSTEVGRKIMELAAKTFKRVTLELGGKSPSIVFPDADLEAAVKGCHEGLFFNQGQVCCAGSRTYVHANIYDKFVKLSVELANKRVVGDQFNPETQQGPQVSKQQFDDIMKYIEIGKSEGCKLAAGGGTGPKEGFYIQPTVFVDVDTKAKIWREEIFGPVQCIRKFTNVEEVIEEESKNNYGLAAAVWTKDLGTINYMINNLEAGTIWVNCYNFFDNAACFGGFKESGIGREMGEYALKNYTEVKQITMNAARGSSKKKRKNNNKKRKAKKSEESKEVQASTPQDKKSKKDKEPKEPKEQKKSDEKPAKKKKTEK